MTARKQYIDTARAILITLVVLGHILNYANPDYSILPYRLAQEFIGAFHMPAFFLLSGMLTDSEKWRSRGAKAWFIGKAKTLLVPYVFFECIAVLYKHFALGSVTLLEGLKCMLTLNCNVGANWFLPAMFMACALYWLYIRFPNKTAWAIAGGVLCIALRFTPAGHVYTVLFRAALGFVFMLAGNLLKAKLTDFKPAKIAAAFVITVAVAAVYMKFSLGNSFFDGVLRSPVLFLISGICGLYFVLGVSSYVPWKWPGAVGQNALTIMGTHQLLLYTVKSSSSPLYILFMLALIAAVEAVLILVFNRFCPALVGKGRKDK